MDEWTEKERRRGRERDQFIREMGISVNKTYIDRWINEQKSKKKREREISS